MKSVFLFCPMVTPSCKWMRTNSWYATMILSPTGKKGFRRGHRRQFNSRQPAHFSCRLIRPRNRESLASWTFPVFSEGIAEWGKTEDFHPQRVQLIETANAVSACVAGIRRNLRLPAIANMSLRRWTSIDVLLHSGVDQRNRVRCRSTAVSLLHYGSQRPLSTT